MTIAGEIKTAFDDLINDDLAASVTYTQDDHTYDKVTVMFNDLSSAAGVDTFSDSTRCTLTMPVDERFVPKIGDSLVGLEKSWKVQAVASTPLGTKIITYDLTLVTA